MSETKDTSTEQEFFDISSQHSATPLLFRAPLTSVRSYYRSQTFTATAGTNALVTAAAPLFSLVNKLRENPDYHNIHSLHEHLVHEIRAFEAQAQTQGCRSETILVARYALCAFFDEIILNTTWGNGSEWTKYKLLMLFHTETSADERFFVILERLLEDAKLYIDIIEFMYLILSLGFMGKYQHLQDGTLLRMMLQNELYHTIRMQRGEISKSLSKPLANTPTDSTAFTPPKPLWMRLVFMSLILCGIYSGLNYVLSVTAEPITTSLNQITTTTKTIT